MSYLQSVTKYCGTTPFFLKKYAYSPHPNPPYSILRECENYLELL